MTPVFASFNSRLRPIHLPFAPRLAPVHAPFTFSTVVFITHMARSFVIARLAFLRSCTQRLLFRVQRASPGCWSSAPLELRSPLVRGPFPPFHASFAPRSRPVALLFTQKGPC